MDAATVVALLGALGLGGVIGAWAKTSTERREKFRDRTIEACTDFLTKYESARRELQAAQTLVRSRAGSLPLSEEQASALLAPATLAWRELESNAFLLTLLMSGKDSRAALDAKDVSILCYRWKWDLQDYAMGRLEWEDADLLIRANSENAVGAYNWFVMNAHDAIRPTGLSRRGSTPHRNLQEWAERLDSFAELEKELRAEAEIRRSQAQAGLTRQPPSA